MKKLMIACACVMALGMMSCKNTNYCYELKVNVPVVGDVTTYVWCTANELDAAKEDLVKTYKVDKKDIKYKKTSKSQADCKGLSI